MATTNWQEVLEYKALTATARKFDFPDLVFVNMVPVEPIDGVVATWDIVKPQIELDTKMTNITGAAQPARPSDVAARSQQMPVTFKFLTLNAGVISQLRDIGSQARQRAGRATVTREQNQMTQRFGRYVEEYMISQALTGSLSLTVNGVSLTIDYEIPSANKPTAGTSWGTTTTNILDDIKDWKRRIQKASGRTPRHVFCNQTVMNRLMRNDDVQTFLGSTQYGVQVAEHGYIAQFMGLTWHVIESHYAASGATEEFTTPYIADNYLIMTPDFDASWITLQRGTVQYPTTDLSDFQESPGDTFWTRAQDSPTGITLFFKTARLPAVRVPGCILYASTG